MPRADEPSRIGARVRALRNATGMKQAQLAEAVGIANESMSRIERGRLQPSRELISRLATAFGVSAGDLYASTPVALKTPTMRPVERRLIREVKDLPDELVEDLIKGLRLLIDVGRNAPVPIKKKAKRKP